MYQATSRPVDAQSERSGSSVYGVFWVAMKMEDRYVWVAWVRLHLHTTSSIVQNSNSFTFKVCHLKI